MRINKAPDVRKREIIQAAKLLFIRRNYQKTSIKDITDEADVAQGLFHYYFKSKEEVLAEVIKDFNNDLISRLTLENLFTEDLNGIQKINKMLKVILDSVSDSGGSVLLKELRSVKDTMLLSNIACGIMEISIEKAVEFIEQGNREGLFRCQHPAETATFFIVGVEHLFKSEIQKGDEEVNLKEFFLNNREAYLCIAMNLLGMDKPNGLFAVGQID